MKAFLFCALFSYFCGRINAFAGIRNIFSGEDEAEVEKRGTLEFALRAMELGMDLDKQAEIDKRAFEQRGEQKCEAAVNKYCKTPELPEGGCKKYNPVIKFLDEVGCSCVEKYECCPEKCKALEDKDWKLCESKKKYGIGLFYPYETKNCCDCDTVICLPCPKYIFRKPPLWADPRNDTHRYFQCDNDCDRPVKTNNTITKCPEYNCERKPATTPAPETCDSKCHEVETKTDKCGDDYKVCKCKNPPQCWQERPEDIPCHNLTQVLLDGVYACNSSDDKTCTQCFQWRYDIVKVKHITRECLPCEIEKVKDLGCGSFETTCECRQPTNCRPEKPTNVPKCHTAVMVNSTDSFMCENSSKAEGTNKCQPCFHWNFIPETFSIEKVTCNDSCQYKKPISEECGSAEECVCIGKAKEHCQPNPPTESECYNVTKKVINGSFMCEEDSPGKCAPCYTWDYTKKKCPKFPPIKCDQKCQTEGRTHESCDCHKKICRSTVIPDCRPTEPTPDLDCYHKPKKEYREGIYSYDEETRTCVRCFRWIETLKVLPPTPDECDPKLRELPTKCVSDYNDAGKCNSLVKKCRRNQQTCTNEYNGDDKEVCPRGNTKITLKTSCGYARDACVDCKEITEQTRVDLLYPDKCYTEETMIVLGKCEISVKKKNKCSRDQLVATACPVAGMKRKVFFDKCDCPILKCSGCSTTKHLDLQLILDSSDSINDVGVDVERSTIWVDLIEYIKSDFIDSVFTVSDSHLAVTKFGSNAEILQELKGNVNSTMFNDNKYKYSKMGYTHTAKALRDSFEAFDKKARWNDNNVIKALLVITDGNSNDQDLSLNAEVRKWTDKGVKTYALGFGDKINLEELQRISAIYAVRVDNLDKVKENIMEHLIPDLCDEDMEAIAIVA